MRRARRWTYRLGQFARHLSARPGPEERALAASVLEEPLLQLFDAMSPGDRAHALCVLRAIRARGKAFRELEQAALLHDVGKACAQLTPWHRGVVTILTGIAPVWLERLSSADPRSWRYPFHVHTRHSEMGALLCLEAGCSPRTVALVRYHECDPADVKDPSLCAPLRALQRADDVC